MRVAIYSSPINHRKMIFFSSADGWFFGLLASIGALTRVNPIVNLPFDNLASIQQYFHQKNPPYTFNIVLTSILVEEDGWTLHSYAIFPLDRKRAVKIAHTHYKTIAHAHTGPGLLDLWKFHQSSKIDEKNWRFPLHHQTDCQTGLFDNRIDPSKGPYCVE